MQGAEGSSAVSGLSPGKAVARISVMCFGGLLLSLENLGRSSGVLGGFRVGSGISAQGLGQ